MRRLDSNRVPVPFVLSNLTPTNNSRVREEKKLFKEYSRIGICNNALLRTQFLSGLQVRVPCTDAKSLEGNPTVQIVFHYSDEQLVVEWMGYLIISRAMMH